MGQMLVEGGQLQENLARAMEMTGTDIAPMLRGKGYQGP